ncbi:MAG: hypothetical protein E7432_00605 [Ruminococcaceae bacterium]|nr:hypothetical protein [Oscillospiraceae bacterium]
MSFIITVYTHEGIVMASDSRITYTTYEPNPNGKGALKNYGIQSTDTTYKTFMCNSTIGLSTSGASSIKNRPISIYIEDFIAKNVKEKTSVEEVSQKLIDYFGKFDPVPDAKFIVAGYDKGDMTAHVHRVNVPAKSITRKNTENASATWDGETEILVRLLNTVAIKTSDGNYIDLKDYSMGFAFFTLQDAVDFAKYAVDVTAKTIAFQNRSKTVGGPIDILAIKPSGAFWVQHKEIHA